MNDCSVIAVITKYRINTRNCTVIVNKLRHHETHTYVQDGSISAVLLTMNNSYCQIRHAGWIEWIFGRQTRQEKTRNS